MQMELEVVLDTGEEGALGASMGGWSMVEINMAMLTFHVNWEVELRDPIPHLRMLLEAEWLVTSITPKKYLHLCFGNVLITKKILKNKCKLIEFLEDER